MNQPLIDSASLAAAQASSRPPLLLDCRARLDDADAGRALWRDGHLPGSQHLALEHDLSAPAGEGGRHPLPSHEAFTAVIQRLGITPDVPVVVYDDMGGQLAAARAWWMLACWAGHAEVRVLDGGLPAWQASGGALEAGEVATPASSDWRPNFDDSTLVTAADITPGRSALVDARGLPRFHGEVEPIDPVAGHIPGARCRPSADNLTADGRFKPAAKLNAELADVDAQAADGMIAYCGSGVTACHNILTYAIAGRPLPRLYAGSWSDWIRDPGRPVATGDG
ncbi:thiosulfate/3-mercaptopyruvate sulfurtransferase [Onishia taeanensis]|uniref:Thiosulfate/3-mercaptopyruvate sulfurtransferase n=1 Tax=Onishia taeanensis TaxID=284577 RepID=A0A328Y6S3_9GAMM|nr:sulfurtransferase [Halomonas taeanensis]RAR64435.1 thiosulfate/3-mercaptopyruvate sulfurtransferase [Halomonas taeanensis]